MSSSNTQPTDILSPSSPDVSPDSVLEKKGVHFNLPPLDDDADELAEAVKFLRRRFQRKEPTATPRSVYGLYLPPELVDEIGLHFMPHWKDKDRKTLTASELSLVRNQGVLFASAYCRQKFPDIPLRWHHTVMAYAGDPLGLHPILVLGHMNSRKGITVDVTGEEMEYMREVLGLGDQEPEWHHITFIR